MNNVQITNTETIVSDYLDYCQFQKRLDNKTLKAYRIDLRQFTGQLSTDSLPSISPDMLEAYIATLHKTFRPKTAKRKIASLKAFFHYLEYRDLIELNPFNKIHVKFREPVTLPKTIPLHIIEAFLSAMYEQKRLAISAHQRKIILRDIAVIELLFATGMRISELCSLKPDAVNLYDRVILIYGKGSKERRIQIGNDDVAAILKEYQKEYSLDIQSCGYFFVNRLGHRLSDQSVRNMIQKYSSLASINLHITPHMFRHSFATCLLEADVDIRYIQEMLGHSSINVTQIYTHVAMSKQKDILMTKHPRKDFRV